MPKPASCRTAASFAQRLMFVLWMLPAGVQADAEAFEAVTIDYEAALSCVDRGAFLDKIRKRTTRFRETRDGARRFVVRIGAEGGRFGGHLEIESQGKKTSGSPVEGRTCDEVVDALALSTALAIDPRSPQPHGAASPPAPTPAEAPAPTPEPPGPEPAPPPPTPAAWHAEVGAELVGAGAVAPGVTPAGALFVGLARRGVATFRLGAAVGATRETESALGTASFQWTAARALACPFGWSVTPSLELLPCISAELGRLTVSGMDIAHPETHRGAWGAAGASARASLALSRLVTLELGGDAIVPITQTSFYFEAPPTKIHEVPWVSWRAEAGVAFALR